MRGVFSRSGKAHADHTGLRFENVGMEITGLYSQDFELIAGAVFQRHYIQHPTYRVRSHRQSIQRTTKKGDTIAVMAATRLLVVGKQPLPLPCAI
jgi:hypothetical protein